MNNQLKLTNMQATDLKVGMQFKDLDGDIVNIIHLNEVNQNVTYNFIVNGTHGDNGSLSYSEFIESYVEGEWEQIFTPQPAPFTLDKWHKIDVENLPKGLVVACALEDSATEIILTDSNTLIGQLGITNKGLIKVENDGAYILDVTHYITLSELNQLKFE